MRLLRRVIEVMRVGLSPGCFNAQDVRRGRVYVRNWQCGGRVLVVEDEALVRLSAREEIQAAGFKVYEAHDADKAIRLLEANSDIELVFADVDIPGSMDGVNWLTACEPGGL
jgi:PleD family two-component response regulator